MMKMDELGVITLPTPAAICSPSDFAMPAFSAFGDCVRSTSCASAAGARSAANTAPMEEICKTERLPRVMMTSPL